MSHRRFRCPRRSYGSSRRDGLQDRRGNFLFTLDRHEGALLPLSTSFESILRWTQIAEYQFWGEHKGFCSGTIWTRHYMRKRRRIFFWKYQSTMKHASRNRNCNGKHYRCRNMSGRRDGCGNIGILRTNRPNSSDSHYGSISRIPPKTTIVYTIHIWFWPPNHARIRKQTVVWAEFVIWIHYVGLNCWKGPERRSPDFFFKNHFVQEDRLE